ncbi:MAG TPA: hypothetical protein VMZ28_16105 [Kofleriaceae bacterium]|nr:hypothetical protein [Kofleriaceae bacterium]
MRLLLLTLLCAGCLGEAPQAIDDPTVTPSPGVVPDAGAPDLTVAAPDLLLPATPDLKSPPDLYPSDLQGLVNCYGVAFCDVSTMFCLKFHDGSPAAPGALTTGPACFAPADDCGTLGQPMNCACIQADSNLGLNCQGACVDNGNNTYDCYKQQ